MAITRLGDTFYSDDGELSYSVRGSEHGATVIRGDGSAAEFLSTEDALDAAELLAGYFANDSDYIWHD